MYFQGKEVFIYNENLDNSGFSPEGPRFLPWEISSQEIPLINIQGSTNWVKWEYLRIKPIKALEEDKPEFFPPEILPDPVNNRGSFLLI